MLEDTIQVFQLLVKLCLPLVFHTYFLHTVWLQTLEHESLDEELTMRLGCPPATFQPLIPASGILVFIGPTTT
jgi:hypothetical protein